MAPTLVAKVALVAVKVGRADASPVRVVESPVPVAAKVLRRNPGAQMVERVVRARRVPSEPSVRRGLRSTERLLNQRRAIDQRARRDLIDRRAPRDHLAPSVPPALSHRR
jgi:hypothetical protein